MERTDVRLEVLESECRRLRLVTAGLGLAWLVTMGWAYRLETRSTWTLESLEIEHSVSVGDSEHARVEITPTGVEVVSQEASSALGVDLLAMARADDIATIRVDRGPRLTLGRGDDARLDAHLEADETRFSLDRGDDRRGLHVYVDADRTTMLLRHADSATFGVEANNEGTHVEGLPRSHVLIDDFPIELPEPTEEE